MKITATQYAKSLYEATAEKSKHEVDGVVAGFIKVLQRSRKMKLAPKIIEKFAEIYNQKNGIVEAEITTRYKRQDTMTKQIEEFIKNKYQAKEVVIDNKIDLNIKGGIIIRVNDEVFDASIDRQLGELRKRLAS